MSPAHCPSCRSGNHRAIDRVTARELVAGYASPWLQVDAGRFFSSGDADITLHACSDCGLRWYTPAMAGDAAFYVALQRHDWYYQADKAEYTFAREHVAAGARLLEVGCGRGAFRRHLAADVQYRGLEFNEGAVHSAQAAGLDVEIRSVEDEAEARPGHYDVVCHFQVLEHVPAPREFLQACASALRPGGSLIVAVPAEDSFLALAESAWLNMPPHHLSRWPDRALQRAFDAVGVEPGPLWHEGVADVHRDWHHKTVMNAGLQSLFGRPPRLVARGGLVAAVARRLHRLPALAGWAFRRGLAVYPQAAHGHSVCLVGTRRGHPR